MSHYPFSILLKKLNIKQLNVIPLLVEELDVIPLLVEELNVIPLIKKVEEDPHEAVEEHGEDEHHSIEHEWGNRDFTHLFLSSVPLPWALQTPLRRTTTAKQQPARKKANYK